MRLIDAERNWEETASDNTGYKLEYNDGIFALYDPQGAILCEFMPDMPTAYDIRDIIEKLEFIHDEIGCAIKIVKQGGVVDDVCELRSRYVLELDKYKRETSCGYTFYDVHHAIPFKYCPYCGNKIKEVE